MATILETAAVGVLVGAWVSITEGELLGLLDLLCFGLLGFCFGGLARAFCLGKFFGSWRLEGARKECTEMCHFLLHTARVATGEIEMRAGCLAPAPLISVVAQTPTISCNRKSAYLFFPTFGALSLLLSVSAVVFGIWGMM